MNNEEIMKRLSERSVEAFFLTRVLNVLKDKPLTASEVIAHIEAYAEWIRDTGKEYIFQYKSFDEWSKLCDISWSERERLQEIINNQIKEA